MNAGWFALDVLVGVMYWLVVVVLLVVWVVVHVCCCAVCVGCVVE